MGLCSARPLLAASGGFVPQSQDAQALFVSTMNPANRLSIWAAAVSASLVAPGVRAQAGVDLAPAGSASAAQDAGALPSTPSDVPDDSAAPTPPVSTDVRPVPDAAAPSSPDTQIRARASDAREHAAGSAGARVPSASASAGSEKPSPQAPLGPFYSPLDLRNWQVNLQATYVLQHKFALSAAYTGPKSLLTRSETGYTLTSTLFLGYRPWIGAEVFVNPETIQSEEISGLAGLAGLPNGENQKGGGPLPKPYFARLFLRQTIGIGGTTSASASAPNQFASEARSRRIVVTFGYYAVTDIFDANAISHDPRTSFLNWAHWTYGASDFAADSRGYTLGLSLEYVHDDWAFRFGRFAQPKQSNGLALDYDLIAHFGDVLEIEHDHAIAGQPGKIRVDGFHNHVIMGAFDDALAQARPAGQPPVYANVRRIQSKFALGLNVEQAVGDAAGLFARLSWNDGRTETYAYAEIERSLSVGGVLHGRFWRRPDDAVGVAYALNGISDAHRAYLSAGGIGFFVGDGRLDYGLEQIAEAFYSAKLFGALWVSVDGQYVVNPAYNRERGPAEFLGSRFHLEF